MQSTRLKTSAGFTLIEMLIIAPIVILVITGFIAVMINMTGDVLASQERSRITYDTEQSLAQMELDIRTANQFPTTTGAVNSPQGANNVTSAWTTTSNGPLVLRTHATTSNPLNTEAENSLFYISGQNASCANLSRVYNTTYTIYIIYFINSGNLYRRTILPNIGAAQPNSASTGGNICDTLNDGASLWQHNSCSTGSGGYCTTKDDLLMTNASSIKLTYYAQPGDTTASADQASASTVGISLTAQSSVAGSDYTYVGTLRASRANTDTP